MSPVSPVLCPCQQPMYQPADRSQNLHKEHFFSFASFPSLSVFCLSLKSQSQYTHTFLCWSIFNSNGCVFAFICVAQCRSTHVFALTLHTIAAPQQFTSHSVWAHIEGIHLLYFRHLALSEFIKGKMLKIQKMAHTTEPQRPWFGSPPGDLHCMAYPSLPTFLSLYTDSQIKAKMTKRIILRIANSPKGMLTCQQEHKNILVCNRRPGMLLCV